MSRGQGNQGGNAYYPIDCQFKDSISDLAFGESQRYLAATSWDGIIIVWEFETDYKVPTQKIVYSDPQKNAFLRCCFDTDCSTVFYGTTSGTVLSIKLNEPNQTPHENFKGNAPIVGLKYCAAKSSLIVLTMDKIIYVIDSEAYRQTALDQTPISMDLSGTSLFVVTLGPMVIKYDMNTFADNIKGQLIETNLQHQIRSISVAKNNPAQYIIGSIFGQVEICVGNNRTIINCHRTDQNPQIYASNSVAIVPNQPCAISAGGDGTVKMINLEKGRAGREQKMSNQGFPLTCVAISSNAEVAAIAQGYDWSRGGEKYLTDRPEIALLIRKLHPNEF